MIDEKYIKIVIGSLLHDIGKVLYRYNVSEKHSLSGYNFIKEIGIEDDEILNQIKYHHKDELIKANIENDDLAYLTYWADNVASGADRRDNESNKDIMIPFDKYIPLDSIFNKVNNNNQNYKYDIALVYDDGNIEYPKDKDGKYNEIVYGKIVDNIKYGLKSIEFNKAYLNSLLSILEANLTYVPSSTSTRQICDISLFDHSKITAAIASCIYRYCNENQIDNFKEKFLKGAQRSYSEELFLLYGMDISGIQKLIYNIVDENALKMLRSKSFYLEMLLENIIDDLLEKTDLSRCNLIYSGGGHAYILLPNTENILNKIDTFHNELNYWFLENFKNELYVAYGYTPCSANEIMNKENGSYANIYKRVSKNISRNKMRRYTARDIKYLNNIDCGNGQRECKICGRTDKLSSENICYICESFKYMSKDILEKDFILITNKNITGKSVPLPFNHYMTFEEKDNAVKKYMNKEEYVRSYSKNRMYTGVNLSSKLWIADYSSTGSFAELAENAKGINRLGVIRADVDNLGKAFVHGFDRENEEVEISSLSRNATFSRKMSMFFKLHLNNILNNPKFTLDGSKKEKRNATIIYSGGDDLFIIGGWNDIIELAVDVNNAFRMYTQNTLSISAGISIVPDKFPVKDMAEIAGMLEDVSKSYVNGTHEKNSITLFDAQFNYSWEDFVTKVINEKFDIVFRYFNTMEDKGNSVIYKLLNYIRSRNEVINLARFAYLLGRMEPGYNAPETSKELYSEFSKKLYHWIKVEEDANQLIMAIYLYVYLNRGGN